MVKHFKRQKLSQTFYLSNTKQSCIDNALSDIADMDNTEDRPTWFWNKSANEIDSNLKDRRKLDIEEPNLDHVLAQIYKTVFVQNCQKK